MGDETFMDGYDVRCSRCESAFCSGDCDDTDDEGRTVLRPEQIDEIRRAVIAGRGGPVGANAATILALCETAVHLRAEWDAAVETRDEANIKLGTLEGETVLERLGLVETTGRMHAELETLRGIVARINDGWDYVMPDAAGERYIWWRMQDGAGNFVQGDQYQLQQEPMTPTEVQAIYGQKETASDE